MVLSLTCTKLFRSGLSGCCNIALEGQHHLKVLYVSVPPAGVGHHCCNWPTDVRHNPALAGVPRRADLCWPPRPGKPQHRHPRQSRRAVADAHLRLCLPWPLDDGCLTCQGWRRARRDRQHWVDTCKSQQCPGKCTWVIRGRSVEVEATLRGARTAGTPAEVLTAVATLYPLAPLISRPHPEPHQPSPVTPTPFTPSPPLLY
ncbi:hypothetical protein E2C01_036540 [Portunus trituberculatus]|uniref:Uncharacterized protein n=1 Tax=Portunus trituberculatus TaxID=210409 RepID=A0A5B7FBF9_PORTR|nr:hypothetical protein [Portunus trituberculatus]